MGRVVAGADVRTDRAVYDAASPFGVIHPGAPPFLVCHGTGDNLVSVVQARGFVLALRDAAQPETVVYVELPGAPHAFDVVRSGSHHRGAGWRRAVPHVGVGGCRRGTTRGRWRSDRSDDHGAYGAIVTPASPTSTAS